MCQQYVGKCLAGGSLLSGAPHKRPCAARVLSAWHWYHFTQESNLSSVMLADTLMRRRLAVRKGRSHLSRGRAPTPPGEPVVASQATRLLMGRLGLGLQPMAMQRSITCRCAPSAHANQSSNQMLRRRGWQWPGHGHAAFVQLEHWMQLFWGPCRRLS